MHCRSRPCQAMFWSVRLSHCHLRRKAMPARSRSWTPRPPSAIGRATRLQFTWQLPPFAAALPSR
jgi:hypothetical protein